MANETYQMLLSNACLLAIASIGTKNMSVKLMNTPQHCKQSSVLVGSRPHAQLQCMPRTAAALALLVATHTVSAKVVALRGGTHLMRFLDVMCGARRAAPSKLLPVQKMPLRVQKNISTQNPIAHHIAF